MRNRRDKSGWLWWPEISDTPVQSVPRCWLLCNFSLKFNLINFSTFPPENLLWDKVAPSVGSGSLMFGILNRKMLPHTSIVGTLDWSTNSYSSCKWQQPILLFNLRWRCFEPLLLNPIFCVLTTTLDWQTSWLTDEHRPFRTANIRILEQDMR